MIQSAFKTLLYSLILGLALIYPADAARKQKPTSAPTRKPGSNDLSEKEIKELRGALPLLRKMMEENKTPAKSSERLEKVEEELEQIQADLEIVREQNKLMIQRSTIGFRDQFFLRLGASMVLPRSRTFSFNTDTGFGAYLGLGRYFGKQNVLEGSLDWDIYPSASLRYRYEFQSSQMGFTWGPMVGMKVRLAKVRPFDNFIDDPDSLKSTFWMVGLTTGFPIARSILTIELVYLANQQSFFFANLGFQFFW